MSHKKPGHGPFQNWSIKELKGGRALCWLLSFSGYYPKGMNMVAAILNIMCPLCKAGSFSL